MRRIWTEKEKKILRMHYPSGGVEACQAAGIARQATAIRQWAKTHRVRYRGKQECKRWLDLIRRLYPTGGAQACIDAGCTLAYNTIQHVASDWSIKLITVSAQAREHGLSPEMVRFRIKRGATLSHALTTPVDTYGVVYRGERKTIAQHARDAGIRPSLAWRRKTDGWPIEHLFDPPGSGKYKGRRSLGPMQKTMLKTLRETGPKTCQDFQEVVDVEITNARRTLRTLAKMGLVMCETVYRDSRARHVWSAANE